MVGQKTAVDESGTADEAGDFDTSNPNPTIDAGEEVGPLKRLPHDDVNDFYKSETSSTMKLHYLDEMQKEATEAFYNLETGDYAVYDHRTGETKSGRFKSGTDGRWSGHQPIEKGYYAVLEHGTNSDFRLESFDNKFGDDRVQRSGQTELRQHGPGRSKGCLAAVDGDSWSQIEPAIRQNRAGEMTVDRISRKSVGSYEYLELWRGTENVGFFGTLKVF